MEQRFFHQPEESEFNYVARPSWRLRNRDLLRINKDWSPMARQIRLLQLEWIPGGGGAEFSKDYPSSGFMLLTAP